MPKFKPGKLLPEVFDVTSYLNILRVNLNYVFIDLSNVKVAFLKNTKKVSSRQKLEIYHFLKKIFAFLKLTKKIN